MNKANYHMMTHNNSTISQIIEYLPDSIFAIDLQGIVIAWNKAIADLTGIQAQDMLGKGDYEYSMPFYGTRRPLLIDLVLKWDDEIAKTYKFIMQEGENLVSETENPPFKPTPTLFWNSASKLYDSEGNCIGAVEVIRDITYRIEHENALRESEERYRTFAQATFEGIVISENGRIVDCNSQYEKMTGYGSSELIGLSVFNLFVPDDREWILESIRQGREVIFEHNMIRKDGNLIAVEVHAKTAGHANKKLRYAVVRDMTERKKVETALQASEARLRTLIDNLPFDCWATDAKGRYTVQNAASTKKWGNHLGKTVEEAEIPNAIKKSCIEHNQVAFSGKVLNSEVEYKHDGHSGVYQKILAPIRVDGKIQGTLGVSIEITERKMAEQRLRENEQRLSAIFARAAVGLCEISPEGKFKKVNLGLCRILGRTSEQLLTMSVADVTHPDDVAHSIAALKRLLEKGEPTSLDKRYIRADGTIVFANSAISRIDDMQGQPRSIIAVTVDMTEQVRAKEVLEQRVADRTSELENRNNEIRELAHRTIQTMENDRRNLSKELHDSIGGTLAALVYQVQGRIEHMHPKPPPEVFPFEKILSHLQDTIKETRYISKQLRPSVLDDFGLAAAINDTISDFSEFYPNIRITPDIQIEESAISDTVKSVIYRVIQESLNNVARHSQANSVNVRLYKDNAQIRFQVKDNGIGFDPQRVFRDSLSLTEFGLQSMKERVELCGGEFQVFSKPGQGTTITAVVPSQT